MAEPMPGYGLMISTTIQLDPFYRHAELVVLANGTAFRTLDDLTESDITPERRRRVRAAVERMAAEVGEILTEETT